MMEGMIMTNDDVGGYTTDYVPSTNRAYYKRARKVLQCNRGAHCTECGSLERLEAHHKDEDITNSALENLEWLCRECHEIHHGLR